MKKKLFLFIQLLTLNIVVSQNLISNSGFEEDMLAWGKNIDESESARAMFEISDDSYEGKKSLKITVDNPGKNSWDVMLIQDLKTVKGNYYELSFHAKSNVSGSKLRPQFQKTTYTSQDIELTSTWQKYTFGIVAKEDGLQLVVQFFEKGVFQLDDIKVINKEKPESELIVNGGFENKGLGWQNMSNNQAKAVFSFNAQDAIEGKKTLSCLVLLKGANTWDIASTTPFAAERYKKYKLSFYAKANLIDTKLRAQIQKTTYTSKEFNLTDKWKEYEFVFSAKENDMELAFHYLNSGLYQIDNVVMKKLSKKKKKNKKKK